MSISQRVSPDFHRLGLFLAALAFSIVAGTLSLFAIQIADGTQRPHDGQTELACAKAKLEAMWEWEVPEGAEIFGAMPASRAVSADWDLKELGCSGATHPTATLDEIFGAVSPSGFKRPGNQHAHGKHLFVYIDNP